MSNFLGAFLQQWPRELMFYPAFVCLSVCLSVCVSNFTLGLQDAQLSQRDRAAECVIVSTKSGRLELGDNIYGHYRSIFNHCDIIGLKICRIRWKTQNKGYYGVQSHSRSSRSVPIESLYALWSQSWSRESKENKGLRIPASLGEENVPSAPWFPLVEFEMCATDVEVCGNTISIPIPSHSHWSIPIPVY